MLQNIVTILLQVSNKHTYKLFRFMLSLCELKSILFSVSKPLPLCGIPSYPSDREMLQWQASVLK